MLKETGLYKNGARWWLRTVRGPISGATAARSTGTDDLKLANRIARMVEELAENRPAWEWLELAAKGELALLELYNHYAAGTLHLLRQQLATISAQADDAALLPWLERWIKEHLNTLDIEEKTRAEYERQARYFITADVTRSGFTEDFVKARLAELERSGSTKRRYLVPLKLFYKYARRRVPLTVNPFEAEDEWVPANNSPRSVFWEFDRVVDVLERMTGEAAHAMVTIFGSGIELGALLDQRAGHINKDSAEQTMVAPGSKNEHREERTIFVRDWAWPALVRQTQDKLPKAPLWSLSGKQLREAFYEAQVAAGVIDAPPVNRATGKKQWGQVHPHTIHDARHSFVVNAMLGLDGQDPIDIKAAAYQLGHADEQMVMRIYSKANIAQRLALLKAKAAKRAEAR